MSDSRSHETSSKFPSRKWTLKHANCLEEKRHYSPWSAAPKVTPNPKTQIFLAFHSGGYVVIIGSAIEGSTTKSDIEPLLIRTSGIVSSRPLICFGENWIFWPFSETKACPSTCHREEAAKSGAACESSELSAGERAFPSPRNVGNTPEAVEAFVRKLRERIR